MGFQTNWNFIQICNRTPHFFILDNDGSDWSELIGSITDYSSKVFQLMCGASFNWGCCLEDYSGRSSLPKVSDLLRGPRQRMYGVLFFEKPGALNENRTDFVYHVEELVMTGPGSLDTPKMVKPIMLPSKIDHPGLKKMWKNQKDREFEYDFKKSMKELGNYALIL